jgi:hypothetical protein
MLELRDGLRLSEVLEVPVELEDGLTEPVVVPLALPDELVLAVAVSEEEPLVDADALGETDGVTLPLGEELAV